MALAKSLIAAPLMAVVMLFSSTTAMAELQRLTDEDIGRASAPERFSLLVTYGDDKCPEAVGDEIIVCAPTPESERYRIPVQVREEKVEDLPGGSWSSAVESLDEVARMNRPDSCSVNGSGGQTGCTQAALRQWFAERRGKINATQN